MKLDMNLVRLILIDLEDNPEPTKGNGEIVIDGVELETINYTLKKMVEGGLVTSDHSPMQSMSGGVYWEGLEPTWHGHQFVMAARDDKRWKQFLAKVGNATSSVSFNVATQILTQLAQAQFGVV